MKTGKTAALVLCLVCAICLLCSCGERPLPGGLEETEVIAQAEQIARQLSDGEYEAVAAEFSPVLAEQLDAERLEQALSPVLKERGPVEKVLSSAATGMNDETVGDYAVVILVTKHQNGKSTFTISIDSARQICGLYMK